VTDVSINGFELNQNISVRRVLHKYSSKKQQWKEISDEIKNV